MPRKRRSAIISEAAAAAAAAAASAAKKNVDTERAAAPGAVVAAVSTANIQNPSADTTPTADSLHISTLLNYLPIIVLVIILLIGFVSWDLMTGNWPIIVTLLLTFIYVVYMNYLTPSKFFELKDGEQTILPSPPTDKFIMGETGSYMFIRVVVPLFLIILGLGFGFGSIAASHPNKVSNLDLTRSMIVFGSMFLIGGVIYGLIQKFFNDKSLSEYIHYVVLSFIIGIPLIVRGNEINNNMDKVKDDPLSSDEIKKNFAENSADLLLGFGLFFQIAFFMAVGYFVWRNSNNESADASKDRLVAMIAFLVIIGIPASVFMAASQKDKGIAGAQDLTKYGQKVFLVHGIIWFIVLAGFLLTLFGQIKQSTVHSVLLFKYALPIIVALAGYFIFPIVFQTTKLKEPTSDEILKMDAKGDGTFAQSGYYQQLRTEVIKDLQQKDPTTDPNADPAKLTDAIQARLDEDKKKSYTPTSALLWIFSVISAFIVIIMGFSFKIRIDLGDKDTGSVYSGIDGKVKTKIIEDKMLSDDWDKILSSNEGANFFAILKIRLAKWFSLVPFLSVILMIMWVSVLFTNITTSPNTSDWIARKFSGDMFPRVKELIDAFFIVIIAGLSLCAILLLPIVKEMNAGGLKSILDFAESVQVWQFNKVGDWDWKNWGLAIVGFLLVFSVGLSWWWHYLNITKPAEEAKTGAVLPVVPDNWGWAIAIVVLLAICVMPTFFSFWGTDTPSSPRINKDFKKEFVLKRWLRQILTTIYLVPWLIIVLFRTGIYRIASLTGIPEFVKKYDDTFNLLKFWKWDAIETDLRMFPTDNTQPTPKRVTTVPDAVPADDSPTTGINETKVSAIGKLIKVILLTISFVVLILAIIYYVYKIDAEFVNKSGGADGTADGGFAAQMNSPTAHTMYVLIAIVGIAGLVAYLREKFTKANNKTPENYLFDDMKTEDETNPLRQLAFGATHIIYVILMIVVWIYDRDKDDKNLMSVTGMTVLGIAILFFHYGLEFIDTLNPNKNVAATDADGTAKQPPSVADLFTNIRFIINTVFFIVLCALAYYKQHGVMVVLILAMFIFHLTKSVIGLKLLKLLWLGIIYIPCLFLDFLQSSQGAVGDTTRPIWIIVAIELVLIAILYGGPYLLNYIGASASQIVAAPVSLKDKYDTNLNTQSPQIFIFHNTGIDRTPEDKAANCPAEEKKRYNYSISGWFILNNTVSTYNGDLDIFNFGDVPRLTYNTSTNQMKLWCNTLDMTGNPNTTAQMIYNSKANYNAIISGKSKEQQARIKMLVDNDEELDTPIPLQKWNYFVINYNGKTMDFFLNNKLIIKSDFMMPDIQMKPITIGDGDITKKTKGLNGSICNFAFHKVPLTKEQIRWTYNMLKTQDPPMIGMTTIEDDVKAAGSTTVYAK